MPHQRSAKRFMPVLLIGALASVVIGCGGADASDKSEDGARAAYVDLATLIKDGNAEEACEKYVTKEAQEQLKEIGSCASLLKLGAGDREELDPEKLEAETKVTIDGDKATFEGPDDNDGELTYVDGGWKVSLD